MKGYVSCMAVKMQIDKRTIAFFYNPGIVQRNVTVESLWQPEYFECAAEGKCSSQSCHLASYFRNHILDSGFEKNDGAEGSNKIHLHDKGDDLAP